MMSHTQDGRSVGSWMEDAGQMFMELDGRRRILWVTESLKKRLGDPRGKTCHRYLVGLNRVCPDCPGMDDARSRRVQKLRKEIYDCMGAQFPMLATVVPNPSSNDRVTGATVLLTDISEKKQKQQMVRISQRHYEKLVSHLPDVVFSLDRQGKFAFLNSQVEGLLGYPVCSMLGTHLWEYVSPDYRELARSLLNVAPNSVWDKEMELLDSDGGRKWVRIRCRSSLDTENTPSEFEGVIRDRTEPRRLEQELKASREELLAKIRIIDDLYEHIVRSEKSKAIAEHTAEVAHELRQPLTIIGGLARRIAKQMQTCEKLDVDSQKECLRIIIKEVQRLERILEGLIDFHRQEAIQLVPVSPEDLIEEVVHVNEERLKEKQISLKVDFGGETEELYLDPVRFQHVIRNLMTNAIEACPKKGTISVETGTIVPSDKAGETGGLEPKPYFEVKISNTGPPIPPELVKRIFDPFFTTKETGTGVGLTLSKRIVEEHCGSISVKSDDEETGFTVWIPMNSCEKSKPTCSCAETFGFNRRVPNGSIRKYDERAHSAKLGN